jgi:hypothetical protein
LQIQAGINPEGMSPVIVSGHDGNSLPLQTWLAPCLPPRTFATALLPRSDQDSGLPVGATNAAPTALARYFFLCRFFRNRFLRL